jgi:hypothetical protein
MIYPIFFVLKPQINYMWFSKEFKVSEFLHVMTFDTLGIFSFDTKFVHHTMETPKSYTLQKKKFCFVLISTIN